MSLKTSAGEKAFNVFNYIFLGVLAFVFLYPIWYVICSSLSSAYAIAAAKVTLWPVGFNTEAFVRVFNDNRLWQAYGNTIFIVIVGTSINLFMTILGAYALSRKELFGRRFFMVLIVFTMYFDGGLIPVYLNVRNLGLYDTIWALLIPNAVSAYNLIIMRTFFQSISNSLIESAKIDGAKDYVILIRIVLPISTAVVAVIALFYGVAHWNSWFQALIYIRNRKFYPLQLLLREVVIQSSTNDMLSGVASRDVQQISETIKYAVIVVATVPILFVYPFVQKYFVTGIMLGSIKE